MRRPLSCAGKEELTYILYLRINFKSMKNIDIIKNIEV